jgi:Flp pilus assembly protein TadG
MTKGQTATGVPLFARHHAKGRKGHAVLEAALLSPWIFFLFIGAFDMGFYSYALIATQNAARVAVMYTSASDTTASDSTTACTIALAELSAMRNMNGITSCDALPLIVEAASVTSGADGAAASQVTVTYQSDPMIPLPGLLMGRMKVRRVAQMRLRS